MDEKAIEKKKNERYKLYTRIKKDKPFKGLVETSSKERSFFKNENSLIELLKTKKISKIFIIETEDKEFNKYLMDRVHKFIKDITGEYPFLGLNGYCLIEPTLIEWYEEEYNLNKIVGLTKEEIEYVKLKRTEELIQRFKDMDFVVRKREEGEFVEGPLNIEPKENEVKVTVIRMY